MRAGIIKVFYHSTHVLCVAHFNILNGTTDLPRTPWHGPIKDRLSDTAVIAIPFDAPPMGLSVFEIVFKKQAIAASGERKVY
jgi:hypothetical protein